MDSTSQVKSWQHFKHYTHQFSLWSFLVISTNERIRQMKKIVSSLQHILLKRKNNIISSSMYWFDQIEIVRNWKSRLNQLSIIPVMNVVCLKVWQGGANWLFGQWGKKWAVGLAENCWRNWTENTAFIPWISKENIACHVTCKWCYETGIQIVLFC